MATVFNGFESVIQEAGLAPTAPHFSSRVDESKVDHIIGSQGGLKRVLAQIEVAAPTDCTIMLYGETGSGKEVIAQAIHELSSRTNRPFVKMSCSAIPSGLLESDLFGHEKGAFTGAFAQKLGRFEMANKGTLFLDEIGELPIDLQPKLLRVLQEQAFERLGSTRTQHVDVRIVAATNRNLMEMMDARQFRADLYYRLNVFPVTLPPLRERKEDIPSMVRHFVAASARRMNKSIDVIPVDVLAALVDYDWPGNVRELQNFMERSVILSAGRVLRPPIGELMRSAVRFRQAPSCRLQDVERDHIVNALAEAGWVVGGPSGAAARLGLPRTTLISKMRKLGIGREGPSEARLAAGACGAAS